MSSAYLDAKPDAKTNATHTDSKAEEIIGNPNFPGTQAKLEELSSRDINDKLKREAKIFSSLESQVFLFFLARTAQHRG